MIHRGFAIGALSQNCGCNIETIRYYERIGLIPRAERRGRYRIYSGTDIDRLRFIKRARGLGFAIEEIRALLELSESAATKQSCHDARQIAAANLRAVRSRLGDLRRMEAALTGAIEACDRDAFDGCPILNALSDGDIPTSDHDRGNGRSE
ncbi:MAG: helix-turn-helix domain-containing protein [Novosphingobium sp.]|nr:helix-turn-helix domain-containing protein [Novosphingobium sp.]